MNRQRYRRLALVIAVALLSGCGGDADSSSTNQGGADGAGGSAEGGGGGVGGSATGGAGQGGAGGGAQGTLSELGDAWCPVYAERYCAAAEACGCSGVPGFADAKGACHERAERGCRGQLEGYAAAIANGTLTAAPSVPAGCLPTLEASLATCQIPPPDVFIVGCPLVWPAKASSILPGPGQSCFDGLCAEGARCSGAGQCAVPAPGASCQIEGDCAAGDLCTPEGTCNTPDYSGPRASCAGPDGCTGELACLASTRRECRTRMSGASCTDDSVCVATEYCDGSECAPKPELGEPCGAGVACADGLGCRMEPTPDEGTCQPLPELGEPCALGVDGPFLCADGLACSAQLCGLPPAEGEPCAVGEVLCEAGLGCHYDGAESLCKPRVGDGEACGLDDSCAAGLFCDFTLLRCSAFYAPGAACSAGNECGDEGACVPDAQGAFHCVPRPKLHEACFLDNSCAEGLACRSAYDAGLCAPPLCAAFPF